MTSRAFDELAALARIRAIFSSAPFMTALGVSLDDGTSVKVGFF